MYLTCNCKLNRGGKGCVFLKLQLTIQKMLLEASTFSTLLVATMYKFSMANFLESILERWPVFLSSYIGSKIDGGHIESRLG